MMTLMNLLLVIQGRLSCRHSVTGRGREHDLLKDSFGPNDEVIRSFGNMTKCEIYRRRGPVDC